jgi:hypothetical protein
MASAITTSIVVDFNLGDTSGILTAEIDDREDGLNKGNTSFLPGQAAGFLVYKTSNVAYETPVISAGSLQSVGSGTRQVVNEFLTFAGSTRASTKYPVTGGLSMSWVGASGGVTGLLDENNIVIISGEKAVGVLKVSYTTSFDKYVLQSPVTLSGLKEFPIVIFVSGFST